MQNKILLISILLLQGCSTLSDPGIKTVIQQVDVPIYMPCKVSIPEKPKFSFDTLVVDNDIFEKTKAILSDRYLHLGYENELLVALKSCM